MKKEFLIRTVLYLIVFFAGFIVFAGCAGKKPIDLSGKWGYKIDSLHVGIEEGWFSIPFENELTLPGTLAGNNIGDKVTKATPWIGKIVDSTLWFDEKYDKYCGEGEYKPPFWLSPVKFYSGPVWYQKKIKIPGGWNKQELLLELESCHWETMIWIDSTFLGTENSLSTPHRYIIPDTIKTGMHTLTIRIDNSYKIPIGINAHSVSDNTQGNWNGIVGSMSLKSLPAIYIQDLQVYPDPANRFARVTVRIGNPSGMPSKGKLIFDAGSDNSGIVHNVEKLQVEFETDSWEELIKVNLPMGEDFLYWSEWSPSVYNLRVELESREGSDLKMTSFGMREFKTNGTQFEINNKPVFLRGTLECNIFPNEGHPPTDIESWKRIFSKAKSYGLNHIRFHSWCPPKAAFDAADLLGLYLQVECGAWATQGLKLGSGNPMDKFVWEESRRIVKEYGNHPSFCLMAYGNEADGEKASGFLSDFVLYWKGKDDRRVYTSSAGWPSTSQNQYYSSLQGRIQEWNSRGSTYLIEDNAPSTDFDFENILGNYNGPFVSHEIGQWCVYPDFREIERYTGVYNAGNLELFRSELEDKGMLKQAGEFLMASGKLQALCYKAEVEAALRTKGMGGFQLLDLHDFPGQGTALVGVLNAFWEEKGYITQDEFRQFCDTTVLLASISSLVLTSADTLNAVIEVSHFGNKPIGKGAIEWEIQDTDSIILNMGEIDFDEIKVGNGIRLGKVILPIADLPSPAKYRFVLSLKDSEIANNWEFFVFPDELEESHFPGKIHFCSRLDKTAEKILDSGGIVWLDVYDTLEPDLAAKTGFTPVYWNSLCFNSQPIHTMGILCKPEHSLFAEFPTDSHTNWQWWDILTEAKAMVLDSIPQVSPVLQMIDSYHSNRKLGLIVEAKVGKGKILVSSIDFNKMMSDRPAARQLKHSIRKYMDSAAFNPEVDIPIIQLKQLTAKQPG